MKKKNSKLIFKATLLLLSLIALVFIGSLAWFTMGQTAYANGINIRSQADGVQVSWDGVNYYDNLTELDSSKVTEGVLGPALNITGENGVPASLKLVTGNGISFFEPYLNRRTGTVLTDGNAWRGIAITEGNSNGRYIDIPLYFRGLTERDVYLAGDSQVSPKSETNYSDYGPFSKDYIAAASRVAFLDSTKENCSFIWAPNADIELVENESGYTKYTTTVEEEVTVSSGGNIELNGGAYDDGKTYYLWTFKDELIDTYAKGQSSDYLEPRVFEFDSEINYFVTEFSFYIPTYEQNNPSIPVIINNSKNKSDLNSGDSDNIAGYDSLQFGQSQEGQHFYIANGEFNLDNNSIRCTNKMYADTSYIKSGEHITIKFGYNPQSKQLTVLNYVSSGGGSFSLGGEGTDVTTTVTYYPLGNNVECALVNPQDSVAVSTGEHNKKAVLFKDSTKINVLPISITLAEQFTAVKTGDGYAATYKFKNNKSSQYLAIGNDGAISFNSSGSAFTLYYDASFNGPLLKTGDYYLVVQNGVVTGVKLGYLDISEAVTVYTGSSYQLNTGLTSDSQTYQYYNYSATTPSLVTLGSSTTPKLFTSTSSTAGTVKIGNTKVATLTRADEDDEYCTATIIMRIWVEGTDREAKTPLADGIFDASFHFISN